MNKTVEYYNKSSSRLGYKLVAGGHRHFGYYGNRKYWYIPHAADAMIDYLADYADINQKSFILDAGCGEGRASLRIRQKKGATVYGIDLVPQSINTAKKRAEKAGVSVDYRLGDYNHLPYKDNYFDVVFTLETFTHSPNPKATIKEFLRVLKPGGRIIIFDYSIKDLNLVSEVTKSELEAIAKLTNSPSFVRIFHDFYQETLPKMNIKKFEIRNLTKDVMVSLNQIYIFSWPFYWSLKFLGKANLHANVLIAHFGKIWAENDTWRYVTVKIVKE